jgi:putative molybdopterin biosynthesis protein
VPRRGHDQTDLIEEASRALRCVVPCCRDNSLLPSPARHARGETLLGGTEIGAREIGMLAACGLDRIEVVRRLKVAVL